MSIYGVGNTPATYTRADMAKADLAKSEGKTDGIKTETKPAGTLTEVKPNGTKTEAAENNGKALSKSERYQKDNAAALAQVKAEVDRRTESMRSLVEKMIGQQGQTLAKADGMWSFLAGGNYNVDAKTKTEAQQAISEDGYWGVEQTSQRIVDFAKNLTGGDPKKVHEMRTAIEKGFGAATKAWGSTLPDISSKTHDSIMEKLDAWEKESNAAVS